MNKTDEAWNKIEEKCHFVNKINQDGLFTISAEEIKLYGQREPRLITKFDFINQQPQIFNDNGLSILPINRGNYILAKMNLYQQFSDNPNVDIANVSIPEEISSLNLSTITSEALALSAANASGLLKDFLEEENLHSTVSGRMGSGAFQFNVLSNNGNLIPISVQDSQEEIDGSQECNRFLALIEAKNRMHPEFMIRQLYYPMRTWRQRLPNKPIRNIFLQYSDGTYYVREYAFDDLNIYNSIRLVKEKKYRLVERIQQNITARILYDIAVNTETVPEPANIPFPQCDDFKRIIYLCELFWENPSHLWVKDDLYHNISFGSIKKRQVDYYLNGALYLGLIVLQKIGNVSNFSLSTTGCQIMETTHHNERTLKFVEMICKHPIFNATLRNAIQNNMYIDQNTIINTMTGFHLFTSEQMYKRRSQTVRSWIKWIILQIES